MLPSRLLVLVARFHAFIAIQLRAWLAFADLGLATVRCKCRTVGLNILATASLEYCILRDQWWISAILWLLQVWTTKSSASPNTNMEWCSRVVKAADSLLFAIVTQEDVYFVDVRRHDDPLVWFRQDLLRIAHSNWLELVESNILRGVKGTVLTNAAKKELRRKNTNHVTQLGDNTISPLGGGTMADGSSLLCRYWALKLLHEIGCHQGFFDGQSAVLRSALAAKGIELVGRIEFKLVLADSLDLSTEVVAPLTADQCLSKDLYRMGFVVVETATTTPVVVSLEEQPC